MRQVLSLFHIHKIVNQISNRFYIIYINELINAIIFFSS